MRKIKIFFTSSFDDIYKDVEKVIAHAINDLNANANRTYEIELVSFESLSFGNMVSAVLSELQQADLIISNLSTISPNVMYEAGISHALQKPMLMLIDNKLDIPFDIRSFRFFTYDNETLKSNSLIFKLADTIDDAIKHPENWIISGKPKELQKGFKTVFVSYSHKDTNYLERLKVHLKPLERKGSIQLWSDTLIQSGEKWKQEIEKALDRAAIAVLLISADFLASDFIVNNELQPLLKLAEDKGTIIIPLVLKPCRFLREHTISQFQSINDPMTPLSKVSENEQEEIYERLSQRIELALNSE